MSRWSRREFLYDGGMAASWAAMPPDVPWSKGRREIAGGVSLHPVLFEMDGTRRARGQPLGRGREGFGGARIDVSQQEGMESGRRWWTTRIRVIDGTTPTLMMAWEMGFPRWSKETYVVFPGAVYAGNRFAVRKLTYPPRLEAADVSADAPVYITDVPHLETGEESSAIALRTSDQSQPAVGIWDPRQKIGWLIFAAPGTEAGQSSWLLEEDERRTSAVLRLCAPGARPWRFSASASRSVSPDKPVRLEAGEELSLRIEVEAFPCTSVEMLFGRLFRNRGVLCPEPIRHGSPAALKMAQSIIEKKHLRENWSDEHALFFSQTRPFAPAPYQAGWIGGLLAALAFLKGTNAQCREYAVRHFVKEMTTGMAPGGLFYGKATRDGVWIPDFALDARHPWSTNWTLVRRQADALWAGVQIANVLDRMSVGALPACDDALRRVAEAFCSIWRKYGDFGQFLDQKTNEMLVGNSTSGALMPAALCLASARYGRKDFLDVAREAGERLYWKWTHVGVTCGGPGDALQCPDSESAFATVEAFAALATATRETKWMERAAAAAHQAATWVMPYDFSFPEGTEFHRLGMRTTGTVWANAQNKHAAPGICTLSGDALATIDAQDRQSGFGDLLRSIHGTLPQFCSTVDRPIYDPTGRVLNPGWVNEKVNTCDWANNVGGVEHESTWAEISLLLSAVSDE